MNNVTSIDWSLSVSRDFDYWALMFLSYLAVLLYKHCGLCYLRKDNVRRGREVLKELLAKLHVLTKVFVPVFEKMWSQEERFGRVRHWRGDFQRGAVCFNDLISKANYFFLRRSHYSRILLAWPEKSVRLGSENWQSPKDKLHIKKHTNKSGLIK